MISHESDCASLSMLEPCDCDYTEDLGDCPYLARWQNEPGHDPVAVCAYNCMDEPECVTFCPPGGWPSRQGRGLGGPDE